MNSTITFSFISVMAFSASSCEAKVTKPYPLDFSEILSVITLAGKSNIAKGQQWENHIWQSNIMLVHFINYFEATFNNLSMIWECIWQCFLCCVKGKSCKINYPFPKVNNFWRCQSWFYRCITDFDRGEAMYNQKLCAEVNLIFFK